MPKYQWQPIQDIPIDLYTFSDLNLRALEDEWQTVREDASEQTLEKIVNEIKREWAIETGKIEGLYTLTKGMTETLIKHGISAKLIAHSSTNRDPELVAAMLKDQQDVIEGLFDFVVQRRQLSLSYIREMHQTFTRHQDTTGALTQEGKVVEVQLIKGDWKKWPNNPVQPDKTVHEYCPPEHVPAEMDRLIELHQRHLAKSVSSEVEAAFLHHRFTQIHPFQDGNGRVARALASLVFLRKGDFPFVVRDEERAAYIDALEEADRGNLDLLIEFMVEKQKEILYKALLEAQNMDIGRDISNLKEHINEHYANMKQNADIFERANRIVTAWRDIAINILSQYQMSLLKIETVKGRLGDRFGFIDYDTIHDDIRFSEGTKILEESMCYTITITLTKREQDDLKLYICSVGKGNLPEKIFATLEYYLGKQISSFEFALDGDMRIANLRFQAWLQEQMKIIFDEWFKFQ